MAKTQEKKTVKGIICGGITAGHTVDRILKSVGKDKPESKADTSHVKYYAGQMKRAGDINETVYEKYADKKAAKPAKAKAEKPAKAKPAKAEKPAKAKPAKAKAEKPAKATRKVAKAKKV